MGAEDLLAFVLQSGAMFPATRIRNDLNRLYQQYATLAVTYIWEDLFRRRRREHVPWLEKEIRL